MSCCFGSIPLYWSFLKSRMASTSSKSVWPIPAYPQATSNAAMWCPSADVLRHPCLQRSAKLRFSIASYAAPSRVVGELASRCASATFPLAIAIQPSMEVLFTGALRSDPSLSKSSGLLSGIQCPLQNNERAICNLARQWVTALQSPVPVVWRVDQDVHRSAQFAPCTLEECLCLQLRQTGQEQQINVAVFTSLSSCSRTKDCRCFNVIECFHLLCEHLADLAVLLQELGKRCKSRALRSLVHRKPTLGALLDKSELAPSLKPSRGIAGVNPGIGRKLSRAKHPLRVLVKAP